jgi:LuxR family transcriptional regulator, maltose regulon positive regulatory protein
VVGVTTPTGYGKSTLLAKRAEAEDRRVGWVSLDRLDDDPAALLSVLAAAYGRASSHTDLIADVRGVAYQLWAGLRRDWPRRSGRARCRSC